MQLLIVATNQRLTDKRIETVNIKHHTVIVLIKGHAQLTWKNIIVVIQGQVGVFVGAAFKIIEDGL